MKLPDLDFSPGNRRELAAEPGYAGQRTGSAGTNVRLRRAAVREREKIGGKVPAGSKN